MAGEIVIPFVGNLTADPVIRQTTKGVAVANFSIAVNPRRFDSDSNKWIDGDTTFLRCTAWRFLAEHIGASLRKGSQVVAVGRLSQRSYEKDGVQITTYEVEVDQLGASLMFATAEITRSTSGATPVDASAVPGNWAELPLGAVEPF